MESSKKTEISLGEKINFSQVPSLVCSALIRTVISLWSEGHIKDLMVHVHSPQDWQIVEDRVMENALQLSQPKSFRHKIVALIKPIGSQVLAWKIYHFSRLGINLPSELCWTPRGTVDEKRTAKLLIKDENLDSIRRYQLACLYCLEDDIPKLWKEISIQYQEDPRKVGGHPLVIFWTYSVTGELNKFNDMFGNLDNRLRTPHQTAFEFAAHDTNKVAAAYFLRKLTSAERAVSLERYLESYLVESIYPIMSNNAYRGKCADVLYFLLTQMTEEQQVILLLRRSFELLSGFMDWPYQEYFIRVAKLMFHVRPRTPLLRDAFFRRTSLDAHCFHSLLNELVTKVAEGFKDYDYGNLFREFWRQSPEGHKEYVIYKCAIGSLLERLIQVEDKESVNLILQATPTPHREDIIFKACNSIVWSNRMDLLKIFIQDCVSSKDIMIKFKERFGYCAKREGWSEFFYFLNELIRKHDETRSCM